jgi:carbamoyl-phosphate synthase large subunit
MPQTALILGASRWQADIIRCASEMGLRTLVTDISPDAPSRALADEFIQIDTNDREGLTKVACSHGVALVLAEQTDRVVPVAAHINERLNLRGIRPQTARIFTDKYAMRNALRESGVAMPQYCQVASLDEARDAAHEFGFPIVIKPNRSQSSLGVFKLGSEEELCERFPQTMLTSGDGGALVEEFIEGTEVTVEGFSLKGRSCALAVSEKEHYAFNPCVARRLAYPPRLDEELIGRIKETSERVVNTLGLEYGISHGEYRLRGRVPYLVEVAARGGGSRIASVVIRHVSSINVYTMLIRSLLGESVEMPPRTWRAANLEFLHFESGKVKTIRGVEEVCEAGLVSNIDLDFRIGDMLQPPTDDRTRHGYFISLGETRAEIDEKAARVKETVSIEYV